MHGPKAAGILLVEGVSDRIALETLAARRGRDLTAEGVSIIEVGGAHAIGKTVAMVRALDADVRLAGLCDAGEEVSVRNALEQAGLGSHLSRESMEALGFYVCDADLEDELIRALGIPAVEELLAALGDIRPLRTLQKEPPWQGQPIALQIRRYLGNGGRKIKYARRFVEALDLDAMPRPLDAVLASV